MDALEHVLHEVRRHAAEHALRTALVEYLGVAARLYDCHVVLALVLSDFAADAHALGQQFNERVVDFVNLVAQRIEALGRGRDVADDQLVEDEVEHVGCHLLLGVAPGTVGVAVALHDQAVEAQVHGLLAQRCHQFARTADVARVAEDGPAGNAAAQLDGDVPHGQVAVEPLLVGREAAVNHAQTGNAGLVDALQSANPQLQVRVHGVLYQHGHVVSLQRVGDFLHRKGVGHRACANPDQVDTRIQRSLNVGTCGHFGTHLHAEFLLHAVQPGQALFADALEAAGLGARLPDAGAEQLDALAGQLCGGTHHLFFGFGRTGSGNH